MNDPNIVSFAGGGMTTDQARTVDSILSTIVRGYERPGNVGRKLFPIVPVKTYGGQVIEFGKEAFRLYNTKRAPGANVASMIFGYNGAPYRITSNALQAQVPQELWNDAYQVPKIDLRNIAGSRVMGSLQLAHEYECAAIARDAAKYDSAHKVELSSTTLWSASTGKPTDDVENAKESVRTSTGNRANIVLLSATAYKRCKTNASIIDRLRYTSAASVTREMLAKLWEVEEVVVGDAIGASGIDDEFSDIWGNDAIVAYVPQKNDRYQGTPSYGYTYAIEGHPAALSARYDDDTLSWKQTIMFDNTPVLCGMLAGFLIKNAGQ